MVECIANSFSGLFLGLSSVIRNDQSNAQAYELTKNSTSVHMVVLDLFRPYIAEDKQHGLRAYIPEGSSPRTIFAASVVQLKGNTLIVPCLLFI